MNSCHFCQVLMNYPPQMTRGSVNNGSPALVWCRTASMGAAVNSYQSWEQIVDEVQSASHGLPRTRAANGLTQMASLALAVVGMEAAPVADGPRTCTPDQSDKPGPSKTRCVGHRKVVFYVCTAPLDLNEVCHLIAMDHDRLSCRCVQQRRIL